MILTENSGQIRSTPIEYTVQSRFHHSDLQLVRFSEYFQSQALVNRSFGQSVRGDAWERARALPTMFAQDEM
jgi:hypothetical protein